MSEVKTILCIPGMWNDRTEIVQAIAKDSAGYLFAGFVLMHTETGQHFEVHIEPHNPDLHQAFEIAGRFAFGGATLALELLEQIEKHRQVLYLIGNTGDRGSIHALIEASIGLLNAGGLAVKVESTGVAYSAEKWRTYSAIGMQNLGMRDVLLRNVTDPRSAHTTLSTFLLYTLIESPTLKHGETFAVAPDAPVYKLKQEDCKTYPEDSPYHNPYGMWYLEKS